MKTLYTIGIFSGSLLLIQIEAIIIMCDYLLFWYLGLDIIGEITSILICTIIFIAHCMTTYQSLKHVDNAEIDIDSLLQQSYDKNHLLNQPILTGVVWRIMTEWKNIKNVAQLNFKKSQNKV